MNQQNRQEDIISRLKRAKRVGLVVKPHSRHVGKWLKRLLTFLGEHFDSVVIERESQLVAGAVSDHNKITVSGGYEMAQACDALISLGGDGTLLHSARLMARHNIPVIGINLGRLGFLVEIAPENMEKELLNIMAGHCRVEERIMLQVNYRRNGQLLGELDICNDIIIKHKDSVRMIELETKVGDIHLNTVWSDGLIISTPTGSTAYALASGGPLLEPTLEAALIVPICPHTLSYRPLIVDPHKPIEVTFTKGNNGSAIASVDGQEHTVIKKGDRAIIQELPHKLQLIQPHDHDYFRTLSTKLRWSEKI